MSFPTNLLPILRKLASQIHLKNVLQYKYFSLCISVFQKRYSCTCTSKSFVLLFKIYFPYMYRDTFLQVSIRILSTIFVYHSICISKYIFSVYTQAWKKPAKINQNNAGKLDWDNFVLVSSSDYFVRDHYVRIPSTKLNISSS